jgi:hypothetical protein
VEIPGQPWRRPPPPCPIAGPLVGASVQPSRAWLRRGAPPPGDNGEADARKARGGTGMVTATAASASFPWLHRRPLRQSPLLAASSAVPPVSGTRRSPPPPAQPLDSFPRPCNRCGQAWQKEGRSRESCGGAVFFNSAPTFPLQSPYQNSSQSCWRSPTKRTLNKTIGRE